MKKTIYFLPILKHLEDPHRKHVHSKKIIASISRQDSITVKIKFRVLPDVLQKLALQSLFAVLN
jgi:hypothetical protein